MNRIFYILIWAVCFIVIVCCSNKQSEAEIKKEVVKENAVALNTKEKTNLNKTVLDSVTSSDVFFQLATKITLPHSFNINDTFNLSDIKNGMYKGKQLPPLSSSYVNSIKKIAYKRYINDAIKKHYSANADLLKYFSESYPQKFYAFGKILFEENNLASQIIYHEIQTNKGVCRFLIMVNYDTLFQVYLHSAMLAVDINFDNISLGSVVSNEPESFTFIKQKYVTGDKSKDIRIEINKGFYYSPPAEGGPNPKDYIKYFND